MKAEHRKELETNVLRNQVGKLVDKMKSPQSSSGFVWGILVLIVALIGIYIYQNMSAVGPDKWVKLNTDISNGEMSKVSEIALDNPGTVLSRSARFQLARTQERSLGQVYVSSERERALSRVCEARASYERLATECADSPLLYQEALMGAARTEEALIAVPKDDMPLMPVRKGEDPAPYQPGTLPRAISLYQTLANLESKYPESLLVKQAKERLEQLKDEKEIIAFYEAMNKDFGKKKPEKPEKTE